MFDKELVTRQVEFAIIAVNLVQIAPRAHDVFEDGRMFFEHRHRLGKHPVRLFTEISGHRTVFVRAVNVRYVQMAAIANLNDLFGGAWFDFRKRLDRHLAVTIGDNRLDLHLERLLGTTGRLINIAGVR